jgi:uncharacterized protein YdaU (DUF1376 family)
MILDNGGPLLDDEATQRMRWVKVNPHELLEGIAELSMEERGFYMTLFFSMYARMGGIPFDEHEAAKILRMDKRVVRRLRDLVLSKGKLYVQDGELRQRRVDHEITEYTRKAKKYLAAAAKREEDRRKLAKVADEIQRTSGKLPANFSQTSGGSLPEVPNSSDQKSNKISVCAAQILREPEPEPEPEPESKSPKPPEGASDGWAYSEYGVCYDGKAKVALVNGTHAEWLERFGDADRLNVALIQAGASLQPKSGTPIASQVFRHLARQAADKLDRDKRYEEATRRNAEKAAKPAKPTFRRF